MTSSVGNAPTPTINNQKATSSDVPAKSNSKGGDARTEAAPLAANGSSQDGKIVSTIPETTSVTPPGTAGMDGSAHSLSLSTVSSAIHPTINPKAALEEDNDDKGTSLMGGEPLVTLRLAQSLCRACCLRR